MGQTANALSRLSNTLSNPGVGDALIQAARTDLDLRRFGAQKKRQDLLDARNTELWESNTSARELAKQKADAQVAPTTINLYRDIVDPDTDVAGLAHLYHVPKVPRNEKDGVTSIVDGAPKLILGPKAKWDTKTGDLIGADGKLVTLPEHLAEETLQKFKRGFFGYVTSRISPLKQAETELDTKRELLSSLPKNSPEHKELSGKIKQAEKMMKTDEWKVDAYSKYIDKVKEIKDLAWSRGAKGDYLRQFDEATKWAQGKIEAISGRVEASRKNALELDKFNFEKKKHDDELRLKQDKLAVEKEDKIAKNANDDNLDFWTKARLKDFSKELISIRKELSSGTMPDPDDPSFRTPMTPEYKKQLESRRKAILDDADELRGIKPKMEKQDNDPLGIR